MPRLLRLFLAVLFVSSSAAAADIPRPQLGYEPVETPELLSLTERMIAEARATFGPSAHAIRTVWIVRSVPREHPARLCRAEVLDWPAWAAILRRGAEPDASVLLRRVWENLSRTVRPALDALARGEPLGATQELAVVEALNALIRDPSGLPGREAEVKRSRRRLDAEAENRALLVEAFAPTLLPAAKPASASRGMACCELVSAAAGVYVLYLRSSPDGSEGRLELAHEVAHLIAPDHYDWCVEGANTLFAKRMAARFGFAWEPWQSRFRRRGDEDPYGVSFRLMEEVAAAAGPGAFLGLFRHSQGRKRKSIDLDGWLGDLPPAARERAVLAFETHGPALLALRRSGNHFSMPSGARKR